MIFQAYLNHKKIDDLMPYLMSNNEIIHTQDLRVIGMNVQKEYNDVSLTELEGTLLLAIGFMLGQVTKLNAVNIKSREELKRQNEQDTI